nr:methylated-DNA--[protein]-cysteine S-methyltransferase [Rhabdochromatium marinum]
MCYSRLDSPLGVLQLGWRERVLESLRLPGDPLVDPESDCADEAAWMPAPAWLEQELQAYFRDARHVFALQVAVTGTAFQQRVWQRLRQIPPGQLCTYGALAAELSTSARALGQACRANPCPIVVPCHRVVAKTGLGGFAGATHRDLSQRAKLDMKAWLLRHEGVALEARHA